MFTGKRKIIVDFLKWISEEIIQIKADLIVEYLMGKNFIQNDSGTIDGTHDFSVPDN